MSSPLFFPLNKDKEDVIPTLKMESEESWRPLHFWWEIK